MTFDPEFYRAGYSIGVGGVVVRNDKVLLVRRASEPRKGDWALPGGYVERDETIHVAVEREVLEESGIHARVVGVLAILHHHTLPEENRTLRLLTRGYA